MSRLRPSIRMIPTARERERTSAPAPEFRERVAESLSAYAAELPSAVEAPAELYDEWVALSLALARGVLAENDAHQALEALSSRLATGAAAAPHDAGADLGHFTWQALLELGARLHLDGASTVPFPRLARHPASAGVSGQILGWLALLGERAGRADDGVVRELGGLHEIFLGLALVRLSRRSRRLRKSRAWLSPSEVLHWPANVRSKRLQRELGLSKNSVHVFGPTLSTAKTAADVEHCLSSLFEASEPARPAGSCVLVASGHRRASGSHYTPWPLCLELVESTLGPLLDGLPSPRSAALLELRVCDPAMGAGAFLIAATRYLADALVAAWRREGAAPAASPEVELRAARRLIATRVVHGVDENSTAVRLARWSLATLLGESRPALELERHLRQGDALIGGLGPEARSEAAWADAQPSALDWRAAFGGVFGRDNPGFDAIIGNPPWVAYVGRAAQPLDPARAAYYAATNPAFKRYRTLHGLFVYRSATLLRHGGRLGLVLPTSVADLAGYSATRAAHDALCEVDRQLPDWGDGAFDGVFQPCMALLSTRREAVPPVSSLPKPASLPASRASDIWPLCNDALGSVERQLLERLARLPRLPRELFGERGFQTTEDDQAHLRRAPLPLPPCTVALREGADVGEFRALPPQLFGDPTRLGQRLRSSADWREVKLLIRQTARFPMATLSDGEAFRNSILAGFESAQFPAPLLLGLLNSSLFRWLHFWGQRDARQGMPQLKVGHLRALPAPPEDRSGNRQALARLARDLAAANAGIDPARREALDALVSETFELSPLERQLVADWAAQNPPPVSRRRPPHAQAPRPANVLQARGL